MGSEKSNSQGHAVTYFRRLNQLLLAFAALIPLLLFIWNWHHVLPLAPTIPSHDVASENSRLIPANSPIKATRLFPYSVIPGGAHSTAELKSALAHDPVAAAHYAGFNVARTRVVRVP